MPPLARAAGPLAAALALALGPAAFAGEGPLFRVVEQGRWGYVDGRGRVVIAPRFDRAEPFSEGRAAVQLGPVRGYVDARGELVLVPALEPAGTLHRPFASGRAAVRSGSRYGYVDREGRVVIEPRFTTADDFSEGFALVCEEQGCGYVDAKGRGVLPPEFMGSRPVRGGWACVTLAMGMGRQRVALYRITGERLPGDFEGCGAMAEGLIAVRTGGLWGYLDAQGRGAIAPRLEQAGDFSEGLAPAREEGPLCGYLDRTGAFAIPPRFRSCGPFSGGLARVDLATGPLERGRIAFVDRAGAVVIEGARAEPPFDSAEDFADGLAAVGVGGEPSLAGDGVLLGYVDRTGAYVWKPRQ